MVWTYQSLIVGNMLIDNDILDKEHNKQVLDWIVNNPNLDKFNNTTTQQDTDREAFAVTYCDDTLPDMLEFLRHERTNVYNIVCIITRQSGDIPEHVDDDFMCYMKTVDMPQYLIRPPHETCVYYVQIDPEMTGGETVIADKKYTATQNSTLTFPSDTPHAVTSMNSPNLPRVVLVCERYRLLKMCMSHLEFPIFRAG